MTSVDFIVSSVKDSDIHNEVDGAVECGDPTANLEGKAAVHEATLLNAGCNVDESSCCA